MSYLVPPTKDQVSMGNGSETHNDPTSTLVARPLLDYLFPGFSFVSDSLLRHLDVDINSYIPLLLVLSAITFVWNYISNFIWGYVEAYCICSVDIRREDEIYNAVVAWIGKQKFANRSRRFVVSSQSSRREYYYDSEDDYFSGDDDSQLLTPEQEQTKNRNALAYTPSYGSHHFWYKRHMLRFDRTEKENGVTSYNVTRENISIACYGRNPEILKDVLCEARMAYLQKDNKKTIIYNAVCQFSGSDSIWNRSASRTVRPLSTVILDKNIKKELLDDITDYLNPATRRWYSNRGIPYRRGYLLYGPPGTGKSSFSLALAGHFKMRVYIVSLSSTAATEESLTHLFADLPRRCVVLLEDIDSAGLTHTRAEEADDTLNASAAASSDITGMGSDGNGSVSIVRTNKPGRLSLSGLLNILDGVASQEGRILIMTTNHLEKLDAALIRPGRIDMKVEFGRVDRSIAEALFCAIFTIFETDDPNYVLSNTSSKIELVANIKAKNMTAEQLEKLHKETVAQGEKAAKAAAEKKAHDDRIAKMAVEFARRVPDQEFSPAELQGFLLRSKLRPEAALAGITQWVVEMREKKEKEKKKDAEREVKRKEEEKKRIEEEERKKKEDEDKNEKFGDDIKKTVVTVEEQKPESTITDCQLLPTPPPEAKE